MPFSHPKFFLADLTGHLGGHRCRIYPCRSGCGYLQRRHRPNNFWRRDAFRIGKSGYINSWGVGNQGASRVFDSVPDSTLVCRGGICQADNFTNGSGVSLNSNGTLEGISTQSRPGASVEELARPFRNGQVGVTTAGDIRGAGGHVVLDGRLGNPNHATVGGITAEQAERLFAPTIPNPVPRAQRGR